MRVVMLASIIIVMSILLAGSIVYVLTENEVVKKLKQKDLLYIAESVASKVDGRMQRAMESSLLLAQDPEIIAWLQNGETDEQMGKHSIEKLARLAKGFDYSNAFIVSTLTRHYWTEEGRIVDTMDPANPLNRWFFDFLGKQRQLEMFIDYNDKREDTFAFINVMMGDPKHPSGVAGVGMNLKSLSDEFAKYKYGQSSHLWLVDNTGKISLSDNVAHDGKMISGFIPDSVVKGIGIGTGSIAAGPQVLEYTNDRGEIVDLIGYPLKSTNWELLFQIDRSETVSFLEKVKLHTWLATGICIVVMTFLFFVISRYLANPYKRALELNEQLERLVSERTRQLKEQTLKLTDSIDYAQRIQEAILPSKQILDGFLKEHFLLWKPRDVVGGDFYWAKQARSGYFIAVGDCTGHGVPGALMTMLAVSILNLIVESENDDDPALIIGKLNAVIKQMMKRDQGDPFSDDGLDIGICLVRNDHLVFAGAKCSLFAKYGTELKTVSGDRKSVGSRKTTSAFQFTNTRLQLENGTSFYMTTDGYLDQNGGEKNYSFGKQRFAELIRSCGEKPLTEQEVEFRSQLKHYMGDEPQRDDITLLGFKA
ncbi:SpoIIE family protein phosphatase [Paenibacillus thalictri]|nr:SpoIIE family protein phosphatase [Paenibacillus thalictri]